MTTAQKKAAEALEWNRFLEFAEADALSEPGKVLIRALREPENWAETPASANHRQLETQEATWLLSREALWAPLQGLQDPRPLFERLGRDAVLEVEELAALRKWLYALDSWVQVPRDEIRGELFKKALHGLPDPYEPLRMLDHLLTPEGELSERASPKLAALFNEIRGLKREIANVLDHLLKTFSQKGVLQENFTDVRDGRYVLPVKIASQGEVDGIIYEASASRQTVWVEPKEVSALNNRLRQRQNDLLQEVFVVLSEASKKLKPFGSELELGVAIIIHWDAVQARARSGLHYAGKPLTVTEDRTFILHQTAHPMLWRSLAAEVIIRNDLELGTPARAFLITGPNTGGKTVLLKTLGMAGICARTGFPFPGTDKLTVPFFDAFFVDLGDPQSIEEHLSSFAGHILRFKEILAGMTERSLVLLDELNTATDPEEGAALGRAFLETVIGAGSIVVCTTHDPRLKALAISDSRILNASMAFDESARTPTFALALGVPGRSRALDTAERLGIPPHILTLARSYLSREHSQFEGVLSKLESDIQEAARARKEAVAAREEAERLRKEWTERTQASAGELMDKARQRLRRILEQAQDEVRAAVRKLGEMKTHREMDKARAQLSETFSAAATRMESALHEEAPEIAEALQSAKQEVLPTEPSPQLSVGTAVRIPKWKSTGTVLELSGSKAKVAMGSIQMTLSVSEIEPLLKSELAQMEAGKRPAQRRAEKYDTPPAPPAELDLRGQRLEDAMAMLDRYLDQAFRSGSLAQVVIIHGLGSGALREGTRKLLKSLPYIKEFRDGGVGMGGTGSTIVEFDRD